MICTLGILLALLANDTVCVMLTPLVVAVMVRGELSFPPYLLAMAIQYGVLSCSFRKVLAEAVIHWPEAGPR